jgi:hypothetical protein
MPSFLQSKSKEFVSALSRDVKGCLTALELIEKLYSCETLFLAILKFNLRHSRVYTSRCPGDVMDQFSHLQQQLPVLNLLKSLIYLDAQSLLIHESRMSLSIESWCGWVSHDSEAKSTAKHEKEKWCWKITRAIHEFILAVGLETWCINSHISKFQVQHTIVLGSLIHSDAQSLAISRCRLSGSIESWCRMDISRVYRNQ